MSENPADERQHPTEPAEGPDTDDVTSDDDPRAHTEEHAEGDA